MIRKTSGLALCCLVAGLAHAENSVWDGVYTEAQAEAGAEVFMTNCVVCHAVTEGAVAGHGPTPRLIGEDFEFRWLDAALADLFDTIRQTMPEAAPNSLSADEYAQLTAYILQLNSYPAGDRPIDPANRALLLDTYIEEAPSGD